MKNSPIAHHEMYTIFENGEIHSGKLDVILKPLESPNGYMIVSLDQNKYSVHSLVARHFLPNPYNYRQVNHKDGNKSNNHVDNLEWCSAEQNINHALEQGLRKGFVHVDTRRALLKRVLAGETVANVCKELPNTHPNTLNRMLRNQATKDGLLEQWTEEAQRKRKLTALRNLEKANVGN